MGGRITATYQDFILYDSLKMMMCHDYNCMQHELNWNYVNLSNFCLSFRNLLEPSTIQICSKMTFRLPNETWSYLAVLPQLGRLHRLRGRWHRRGWWHLCLRWLNTELVFHQTKRKGKVQMFYQDILKRPMVSPLVKLIIETELTLKIMFKVQALKLNLCPVFHIQDWS